MATIVTEVYVSLDGLEFIKLDLHKDESIPMKYTQKDLQDISKIFAPYSQSFTFPYTAKNAKALGHFGNTEVFKINKENKFTCKVYTDGVLNFFGFLQVTNLKYKNNKPVDFLGNFATIMVNLKDRIGNDTLQNLSEDPVVISWKADNVFNRIKNTAVASGITYFVPLISNNRVWNYSVPEPSEDNIAYRTVGVSPTGTNLVNIGELRPAIKFTAILDLIKSKYNLSITSPVEALPEINDLYVWCNAAELSKPSFNKFIITSNWSNESPSSHGTVVTNSDSSLKITKNGVGITAVTFVQYRITLVDLVIGDDNETATANVQIIKKSTGEQVLNYEFEVSNGNQQLPMNIPIYLFTSNEFEFFTYIRFSKPTFWRYSTARVLFRNAGSDKVSTMTNNFNSTATESYKIDLLKSLPNVKVIDFLTSYFKICNMSVFDVSPENENLFWLTPSDINTSGQNYSKAEVDYSRFVDFKELGKADSNKFNYYNFKHATSSYRSNRDYYRQFGVEYGQLTYPEIKPAQANEFKVETNFSIIPPVLVVGHPNLWTAYGFTDDAPEINDDGLYRYTPGTEELTLFYNQGNHALTDVIGCQNVNGSDVLVNSFLNSYIKVMPFNISNLNSIAFSVIVISGVEYDVTLFSKYYQDQIARLLDPNTLSHSVNMTLPSSEIYLNDTTYLTGQTPKGFRLQNEVIIGETKFTILDSSIDITTGKAKLTLLNF